MPKITFPCSVLSFFVPATTVKCTFPFPRALSSSAITLNTPPLVRSSSVKVVSRVKGTIEWWRRRIRSGKVPVDFPRKVYHCFNTIWWVYGCDGTVHGLYWMVWVLCVKSEVAMVLLMQLECDLPSSPLSFHCLDLNPAPDYSSAMNVLHTSFLSLRDTFTRTSYSEKLAVAWNQPPITNSKFKSLFWHHVIRVWIWRTVNGFYWTVCVLYVKRVVAMMSFMQL